MKIIEEEDLRGNSTRTGEHLQNNLKALMEKHKWIGDVRGMGLFAGAELVADRDSKDPVDEKMVAAIVGDCMQQGVIVGATNKSLPGFNNTLLFAPSLIATKDDIDHITDAVDQAITRVLG
jgi:taurine-pyruvate aminotransferase